MALDYDFAWRRAINVSGTDIRASRDQPVLVEGFQYTIVQNEVANVWFFITNVMDLRVTPGFVKGSDQIEDAQAAFHRGGDNTFEMGRNECEDGGTP